MDKLRAGKAEVCLPHRDYSPFALLISPLLPPPTNRQQYEEKIAGLEQQLLDRKETITALRQQLKDVKDLNINMLAKMQVCKHTTPLSNAFLLITPPPHPLVRLRTPT